MYVYEKKEVSPAFQTIRYESETKNSDMNIFQDFPCTYKIYQAPPFRPSFRSFENIKWTLLALATYTPCDIGNY